jgi:hypothetical protein
VQEGGQSTAISYRRKFLHLNALKLFESETIAWNQPPVFQGERLDSIWNDVNVGLNPRFSSIPRLLPRRHFPYVESDPSLAKR